jgi:hypothetical protein
MPAAFFAGTSFGADRDDLKLIPKSSERRKEGVGETSGQTAGSNFERALAPFEADPAEETNVSSFGADGISVRNFTDGFAG